MAKGENPQTRSARYAGELKRGKNSFTGKPLTAGQAGFRMGVLNEREWSGKIYKYKHKKGGAKPRAHYHTNPSNGGRVAGSATSNSKRVSAKKNG